MNRANPSWFRSSPFQASTWATGGGVFGYARLNETCKDASFSCSQLIDGGTFQNHS